MEFSYPISKNDLKEPYIFFTDFLELADIIKIEQEFKKRQVNFRKNFTNVETDYPELFLLLGKEKAERVAKILSGSYVYFPEFQSGCLHKIKALISKEFNGYNYTELAKRYGYSERHIRRLMEGKPKYRDKPFENQITLDDLVDHVKAKM